MWKIAVRSWSLEESPLIFGRKLYRFDIDLIQIIIQGIRRWKYVFIFYLYSLLFSDLQYITTRNVKLASRDDVSTVFHSLRIVAVRKDKNTSTFYWLNSMVDVHCRLRSQPKGITIRDIMTVVKAKWNTLSFISRVFPLIINQQWNSTT